MQLIFEALGMLGRGGITDDDIKTVRTVISVADRQALASHIGDALLWMQPYLRRIAPTERAFGPAARS